MSAAARLARAAARAARAVSWREALEGATVTALFFGGLAMAAYGVALVSLPAGLIVGGLALAAIAGLYARSLSEGP